MNALSRSSLAWIVALLAPLPAVAQRQKLSGPLPRVPLGFVSSAQVSPDGVWAVYADDGLFGVPVKADLPAARLDAPGTPGSLEGFAIAADSARVVFVQGGVLQIVPIGGGEAPRALADGVDEEFALTPDGLRVLFTMPGSAGTAALFGALLEERFEPVELDPLESADLVDELAIASDSAHVVYRVRDADGHHRLFSAPVGGGGQPSELGPLSSQGGAQPGFQITADGARAVFLYGTTLVELYSAELDGAPRAVKLNAPLAVGVDEVAGFEPSPDGMSVFYSARLAGRSRIELYRVSVAGSASVRLTPEFAQNGFVRNFAVTPDGGRVLYRADQDAPGVVELYTVPAAGGASTRLSGPLVAGGDVLAFHIAPDSEHVVYRADQEVDDEPVLYSVALTRVASPVRLADHPHIASTLAPAIGFTHDGSHLVFTTRPIAEELVLRGVRVDGSAPARVLAASLSDSGLRDRGFRIVPGSTDVVCRAALEIQDQVELFRVALEGDEPAQRLSLPLFPGDALSDVEDFRVAAGGAHAVYRTSAAEGAFAGDEILISGEVVSVSLDAARRIASLYPVGASGAEEFPWVGAIETSRSGAWVALAAARTEYGEGHRLFGAPVDGTLPAQPLAPAAYELLILGFATDERVVYEAVDWESGDRGLFSVPLQGGTAPADLLAGLPLGGWLLESFARVDPTGQRVVFVFGQPAAFDVYAVPSDGSAPAVRLNAALGGGNFIDTLPSPDGTRVVFTQDAGGDGAFQTYTVPIDAGAPALRLNPPLPPFGDSFVRAIGPDGARVVFLADLTTDQAFDLYSVPIAGGPATLLNPPLAAGGAVRRVGFSPDGARVVYVADQEQDEVYELYSAPSAGGASAVKLSQPLVAGGDVDSTEAGGLLAIADGRVVYRADAQLDERHELWSAPLAGGAAPVRLSQGLPDDRDVLPAFVLSPDGERVLYQADAVADGVFELFVAATDRDKTARRVNGPLPPGGSLGPDYPEARFDFAGNDRVLYIGSEDDAEIAELFGVSLGKTHGAPSPPIGR